MTNKISEAGIGKLFNGKAIANANNISKILFA